MKFRYIYWKAHHRRTMQYIRPGQWVIYWISHEKLTNVITTMPGRKFQFQWKFILLCCTMHIIEMMTSRVFLPFKWWFDHLVSVKKKTWKMLYWIFINVFNILVRNFKVRNVCIGTRFLDSLHHLPAVTKYILIDWNLY